MTSNHFECDCVPDIGPSHCHGCSEFAGREVEWSERFCPGIAVEQENTN